jgi:hypothetical protein
MEIKTLVIAAVIIAATAVLATAPAALNAMAAQPRECFHKGTGDEISCSDTHGSNAINCNRGGQQCSD